MGDFSICFLEHLTGHPNYFDNGHGFFLKALLRRKRLLTLFRFGMLETFGQMWFDAGYIIRKLRKTVL